MTAVFPTTETDPTVRQGVVAPTVVAGSVTAPALPLGKSNHAPKKALQVASDFSGGEDGTGTDSTGRLNLYSFQRAAVYSLGENIRRFIMRADAKSMDAWYLPTALYDGNRDPVGTDWIPVVWTGAHWEANAHNGIHAHWSVERKNGRVTFGGNALSADGVVNAVWAGGAQGYSAKPSTAIGNSAAYDVNLAATSPATDRALQIRAQGDASSRFVLWGDGKIEWGTATGRDTNLYRLSADTLKTDDSLQVALTFRHLGASLGFYNAAAVAKPTVAGSRGANAALASLLTALASLGLVTDTSTA
jgi:hypothetical protein